MRARFFWIALVLIGISWTLNSIYANSKKLVEPIFLDQYTVTKANDDMNTTLTFYYLTNKNDMFSPSFVNTGGVGGHVNGHHSSYATDRSDLNVDMFTHHALRSIEVSFNSHELEPKLQEGPFSFKEMKVFFSDGREMTAQIGEIIIQSPTEEQEILIQRGSGSNSSWNEFLYEATEPLSIEKIESSHGDDMVKIDWGQIGFLHEWDKIPGNDFKNLDLPMELEENEGFTVYTRPTSETNGYSEPRVIISGTSRSGKKFKSEVYNSFTPRPYLTQENVNNIIREKSKEGTRLVE